MSSSLCANTTIRTGYADEVPMISKFLWRKGYLRMPTTCSEEEHGVGDDSTCRASCPAEVKKKRHAKYICILFEEKYMQEV